MKLIEFPNREEFDEKKSALEFLDVVKQLAEEDGVIDIVVVMRNEDGEVGAMKYASDLEAIGMLALALREL